MERPFRVSLDGGYIIEVTPQVRRSQEEFERLLTGTMTRLDQAMAAYQAARAAADVPEPGSVVFQSPLTNAVTRAGGQSPASGE